jgi:hypothetical protein
MDSILKYAMTTSSLTTHNPQVLVHLNTLFQLHKLYRIKWQDESELWTGKDVKSVVEIILRYYHSIFLT